jgi:hypothetical protein
MCVDKSFYLRQLRDPFGVGANSGGVIRDGSVPASVGVTMRSVGRTDLGAAHRGASWILLVPGWKHCLQVWSPTFPFVAGDGSAQALVPSNGTILTTNFRMWRGVSYGLRLSLLNSPEEDEGYWEAFRWTSNEWEIDAMNNCIRWWSFLAFDQMSNFASFASGRLRDLDKYEFKLNSLRPKHAFTYAAQTPVKTQVFDEQFDVIVIKLMGRKSVTNPSSVRIDAVMNIELVYGYSDAKSLYHIEHEVVEDHEACMEEVNNEFPNSLIGG